MVCTNMAARGLDTLHVDHVIQFDFAKNAIDYIHRVGRTGRMGQTGSHTGYVTNFVRRGDYELEQRIRGSCEGGEALDKWISRKRSFKKNLKRNSSVHNAISEEDD